MTISRNKYFENAPILGRIGTLETRLARSEKEVRAAQRLRYQIFYNELGAICDKATRLMERDADRFDEYCDHLLVLDEGKIVGTYRLLLDTNAKKAGGYYSQTEFDLSPILRANPNLRALELGRSCILPKYRSKRTMELLWAGTWAYAVQHKVGLMFGCASFAGTNPEDFADALTWLGENAALAPNEDCVAKMDESICLSELDSENPDTKSALGSIPPLLKGYLRVGAKVGSEAVIDRQFGTTDVLVVLKVADISPRYIAHYGADASRFAA